MVADLEDTARGFTPSRPGPGAYVLYTLALRARIQILYIHTYIHHILFRYMGTVGCGVGASLFSAFRIFGLWGFGFRV